MLVQIVDVRLRGGYRVFLRFDDGAEGEVDISEIVPFDGVFSALRDPEVFAQVTIDSDWGTIRWPNDLDLAPEPLYQHLTGRDPLAATEPRV